MRFRKFFSAIIFLYCTLVQSQNPIGYLRHANVSPVVDGIPDAIWNTSYQYNIVKKMANEYPTLGPAGTTYWQGLWTNEGVYFYIEVNDDVFLPCFKTNGNTYCQYFDNIELYFNVNKNLLDHSGVMNNPPGHYAIYQDFSTGGNVFDGPVTRDNGIVSAFHLKDPGYSAEYFIPFSALKNNDGKPMEMIDTIGFDIIIQDADNTTLIGQRAVWANVAKYESITYSMDDCGHLILEDAITNPISEISVSSTSEKKFIDKEAGTLQMTASFLPINASWRKVEWSVQNLTGRAVINQDGILTARSDGTVKVIAKALDGSGITGSTIITVSCQLTDINDIDILGDGNFLTDGPIPESWHFSSSTSSTALVIDGVLTITSETSDPAWYTMFAHNLGEIKEDTAYTLQFLAWADEPRYINILLQDFKNNYAPVGFSEDPSADGTSTWLLPITQDPTEYKLHFKVGQMLDTSEFRLVMWFGSSNETVYLDNISIVTDQNLAKISTPVSSLTIRSEGDATSITENGGQLQLYADLIPANATYPTIAWRIVNGTGKAEISKDGLVTALTNGSVIAYGSTTDGSGVENSIALSVSNQLMATHLSINSAEGSDSISTNTGVLHMQADLLPENVPYKNVSWTLTNQTGMAEMDSAGLLRAIKNGTVKVQAVTLDGSNIKAELIIYITNQKEISDILITNENQSDIFEVFHGSLQFNAQIIPNDAFYNQVQWSVVNGSGMATIDAHGLLQALQNGSVTVKATSTDGRNITASFPLTLVNQTSIEEITIRSEGNNDFIAENNGSLQLYADILPEDAAIKNLKWAIVQRTGDASIDQNGLVTAKKTGIIVAVATPNDGSNVFAYKYIGISNQVVAQSVIIHGENNKTAISMEDKTLQMYAEVIPSTVNQSVTWSVLNGTGKATISQDGILTGESTGKVLVRARTNDGSQITGSLEITIVGLLAVHDEYVSQLNIYPLPANHNVIVELPTPEASYSIYNNAGIILKSGPCNGLKLNINLDGLAPGYYYLKAGKRYVGKIIKVD